VQRHAGRIGLGNAADDQMHAQGLQLRNQFTIELFADAASTGIVAQVDRALHRLPVSRARLPLLA
jgi:hypothetical protein